MSSLLGIRRLAPLASAIVTGALLCPSRRRLTYYSLVHRAIGQDRAFEEHSAGKLRTTQESPARHRRLTRTALLCYDMVRRTGRVGLAAALDALASHGSSIPHEKPRG